MYNFLIYHAHLIAIRSESNREHPFFAPLLVVTMCFLLNMGSLTFLIEGLFGSKFAFIDSIKTYRIFYALGFSGLVFGYYLIGGRYNRIVNEKFELDKQNSIQRKLLPSILVVLAYYVISGFILFLTAQFRNQTWTW